MGLSFELDAVRIRGDCMIGCAGRTDYARFQLLLVKKQLAFRLAGKGDVWSI